MKLLNAERILPLSNWEKTRNGYVFERRLTGLPGFRKFAIQCLGWMREDADVDSLIRIVEGREYLADEAATALGDIGDTRAVPVLLAFLAAGGSGRPGGDSLQNLAGPGLPVARIWCGRDARNTF